MRRAILFAGLSAAFTTAVACATSNDTEETRRPSSSDSGTIPETDSGTADATDATDDVSVPTCSGAGWCITSIPDRDLVFRDIWPLDGRAFAIAESATLGAKILEWTEVDGTWHYIDDNSQNQVGGQYAGTIWAPGPDEVYYAVAPGYVFRGKRLSPPQTGWSWSSTKLEDHSHEGEPGHEWDDHGHPLDNEVGFDYPALGVWGIGDSVFAWYSNSIYRQTNDASGAPTWVADYVANDADASNEHLAFVSAGGTTADDVWFSGGRGTVFVTCPLVVHKTAAKYERIVDSIVGDDWTCTARDGFVFLDGGRGWVTDLKASNAGAVVGMRGAHDLVTFTLGGDSPTATYSPLPSFASIGSRWYGYSSLWVSSPDVWLTAWGLVVHGQDAADAASFRVSTLSLNGSPLDTAMYRVRGTSSTNLWAIGNGHAMHKTTP